MNQNSEIIIDDTITIDPEEEARLLETPPGSVSANIADIGTGETVAEKEPQYEDLTDEEEMADIAMLDPPPSPAPAQVFGIPSFTRHTELEELAKEAANSKTTSDTPAIFAASMAMNAIYQTHVKKNPNWVNAEFAKRAKRNNIHSRTTILQPNQKAEEEAWGTTSQSQVFSRQPIRDRITQLVPQREPAQKVRTPTQIRNARRRRRAARLRDEENNDDHNEPPKSVKSVVVVPSKHDVTRSPGPRRVWTARPVADNQLDQRAGPSNAHHDSSDSETEMERAIRVALQRIFSNPMPKHRDTERQERK